MIAGLISLALQAAIPLINLFIRNSEKKRQMKENCFKLIENHSKDVMRNVALRRDLEKLRAEARGIKDDKKNEKPS